MNRSYSLAALGLSATALLLLTQKKRPIPQPTFERITEMPDADIPSIIQNTDEIKLIFADSNVKKWVYKDGQLLFCGVETSMTDRHLTPNTVYTYTIEKMNEDGGLSEKILIQTSTAADKKEKGNVLKNHIFSTIVEEKRIHLTWERINGVEEYIIFRNNSLIGSTKANFFTDPDVKNNIEYTYSIKAKRPIRESKQTQKEGKFIFASVIGFFKKGSSIEKTAMEEFWMTKKIAPIDKLMQTKRENFEPHPHKQWKLRYTTFLTKKWVKNPNILSKYHYFIGDNRGFEADSSSYRTRTDIFINENNLGQAIEISKDVGRTKAYNWLRRFSKEATSSDETIQLEEVEKSEEKTAFLLSHSVSNPLVVAPAIDYEVYGVFYQNGNIDICGIHDQSPNHEVYLAREDEAEWLPIHQAKSKGLEMMAEPMASQLWRYSTFI